MSEGLGPKPGSQLEEKRTELGAPSCHIPIMLQPLVEGLGQAFLERAFLEREDDDSREELWWVDGTLGGGGHTAAALEFLRKHPAPSGRPQRVLSIDCDAQAVARGQVRFAREIAEGRLELAHVSFANLGEYWQGKRDGRRVSARLLALMVDLGFSSDQLADPERGLSFQQEGPLDMRLNRQQGMSCAQLLAQVSERELAELIASGGEEPFAREIAAHLVLRREQGLPLQTTQELAQAVIQALPRSARHGRIHGATRTFQALRIAVNQELVALDRFLSQAADHVVPGGRLGVLSFHSLEDRRVKQALREAASWKVLTKKPQVASTQEVAGNPRARSAKLRIAQRIGP